MTPLSTGTRAVEGLKRRVTAQGACICSSLCERGILFLSILRPADSMSAAHSAQNERAPNPDKSTQITRVTVCILNFRHACTKKSLSYFESGDMCAGHGSSAAETLARNTNYVIICQTRRPGRLDPLAPLGRLLGSLPFAWK